MFFDRGEETMAHLMPRLLVDIGHDRQKESVTALRPLVIAEKGDTVLVPEQLLPFAQTVVLPHLVRAGLHEYRSVTVSAIPSTGLDVSGYSGKLFTPSNWYTDWDKEHGAITSFVRTVARNSSRRRELIAEYGPPADARYHTGAVSGRFVLSNYWNERKIFSEDGVGTLRAMPSHFEMETIPAFKRLCGYLREQGVSVFVLRGLSDSSGRVHVRSIMPWWGRATYLHLVLRRLKLSDDQWMLRYLPVPTGSAVHRHLLMSLLPSWKIQGEHKLTPRGVLSLNWALDSKGNPVKTDSLVIGKDEEERTSILAACKIPNGK